MTLKKRSIAPIRTFNATVSYRADEVRPNRLRDCRNGFSNQDIFQTRYGMSRYNTTTLGGSVLSVSFFKKNNDTRFVIVKIGTVMYSVSASGSHTAIKSGLSASTKHRAITLNNRHIIGVENDGLFFYDGTNFASLGQAVPSAPTVGSTGGVSATIPTSNYIVALTFYSSTTGFETNHGTNSSIQAITLGERIDVSAIPTTATNPTIDTVRVYLKDSTNNGSYLYIKDLALGVATTTITAASTSTSVPPTSHATPTSGGAKYLTEFNGKLVRTGNPSFPNDVDMSEQFLPDAWDDRTSNRVILYISGNGKVSGIATGFYNESTLDPYLVIFKPTSITIYSEKDDFARLIQISDRIGCVSHDTIQIKNGDVFFMSANGWRIISNGALVKNKTGDAGTLGDGDIDDIFKSPGYVYELNKTNFSSFFSVYYHTLDQYMTFVSESGNANFVKTYVYEFDTRGFKVYEWPISMNCACNAEDSSGNEIILMGDGNGYLYEHSVNEDRTDIDATNTATAIAAFVLLYWMDGNDYDCSFNFRELILRAIASENSLTVKGWTNFSFANTSNYSMVFSSDSGLILDESRLDQGTFTDATYSLENPASGFMLDVSRLDEQIFTDERTIKSNRIDINRVGENLLLGFYQEIENGNMNLISAQVNFSKNGNRN